MKTALTPLQRVMMTIGCRDCDSIPKVDGAGKIFSCKGKDVQRMHNGILVEAGGYYGDWMAHIIRSLQGHHEPQEELLFYYLLKYVRHHTTIIELGCFWAYYSLWYLHEIPGSRAFCVEPDIKHLEIGINNAKLNNLLSRANFINAWVGGEERSSYASPTENSSLPVELPMISMKYFENLLPSDPIELVHADTQGAELSIIKSMRSLVDKNLLRFVLISTHHSSISGSATIHFDCVEELQALGATILVEHDVLESYSGDGLILASFYPEDRSLFFPEISRNVPSKSLFNSY